MSFVMRTTKPEAGNKYYIRKESGGYSDAVQGLPKDRDCDVLSNCVGYAYGRFNEIGGYGYCKYLLPTNAENFMKYKGDCESGQKPKLGACMVWRKGKTFTGSDGAGHVAIVEKIISETEVYTSESAYGSVAFWNQVRKKGIDGNWGAGSDYTFIGFIYNPAVKEDSSADLKGVQKADTIQKGDIVAVADNAVYYNSKKTVPMWVRNKNWIVRSISDSRAVIDKSEDKTSAICSPIHVKYLKLIRKAVDKPEKENFAPYRVKITTTALNIRKSAGTNASVVGCIRDKGIYTIVDEADGIGATKWGKLKSGAGWIALDYTLFLYKV